MPNCLGLLTNTISNHDQVKLLLYMNCSIVQNNSIDMCFCSRLYNTLHNYLCNLVSNYQNNCSHNRLPRALH